MQEQAEKAGREERKEELSWFPRLTAEDGVLLPAHVPFSLTLLVFANAR